MVKQGGASKEDIELLPKYIFHQIGSEQKVSDEAPGPCEGVITECETDSPIVRRLTADDAVSLTYSNLLFSFILLTYTSAPF